MAKIHEFLLLLVGQMAHQGGGIVEVEQCAAELAGDVGVHDSIKVL